ncbi:MAG: MarR family transcriptional regulator [Burkholderiaceae bacterium]
MYTEFYRPGQYQRRDALGWMLSRLKQSITCVVDQRLNDYGLTHAQWVPLLTLRFSGDLSVVKLAGELGTDAGALTRLLDRLEAKKLCRRERSTEDRRVVMVSLTEEGERVSSKLLAVLSDVYNAHLQGFSHEEWQTLMGLLKRLIANGDALRQADAAPAPEAPPSSDSD